MPPIEAAAQPRGRSTRTWLVLVVAVAVALALPAAASAQDASAEELPPLGTPLEPGRYQSSAVGPTIEFRVEDGWVVGPGGDGPIFTLQLASQPGTYLTVTRFDGAAYVDSCDPTSLTEVETTVPRLTEIVAGNPFLNPGPPEPIEVDGYRGLSLDIGVPIFDQCPPGYLLIWELPMPDGSFIQYADQQSRFIILDVDGDVVVVSIESFPGVPFGSLLERSMELVRSMRIEPGEYVPPSPAPSAPPALPQPSASPSAAPGDPGQGAPA